MRVSREVAQANRKNVVKTASRLFREKGIDGIGVAALMKEAGLTQGGFYKQFEDKSALVAEAMEAALNENSAMWEDVLAASDGRPNEVIGRWYLSATHLLNRAGGCCFAASAAEAPRQGEVVRRAFTEAIGKHIDLLAGPDGDRQRAMQQLSIMVGAMVLARATDSKDLAQDLLESALKQC